MKKRILKFLRSINMNSSSTLLEDFVKAIETRELPQIGSNAHNRLINVLDGESKIQKLNKQYANNPHLKERK